MWWGICYVVVGYVPKAEVASLGKQTRRKIDANRHCAT